MPKKKLYNLSDNPELINFLPSLSSYQRELGFIAGQNTGDNVYNVKGCKATAELILVQTYAADQFFLAMRVGDGWVKIADVPDVNKVLEGIRANGDLVEKGPSPSSLAQIARKEREEAESLAQAEAYMKERSRIARERLQDRKVAVA